MRYAPRYCSECGTLIPTGTRCYAEIEGGWAVEHSAGGAHNVHLPEYTGRVLCETCFDRQRVKTKRATLRPLCDNCHEIPVRLREIHYAWTELPATKAVHDAIYGPRALCQECWYALMEGEQTSLFP